MVSACLIVIRCVVASRKVTCGSGWRSNLTQAPVRRRRNDNTQAPSRPDTALLYVAPGDPVLVAPGWVAGHRALVMWVHNDQHQASPIPDIGHKHASMSPPAAGAGTCGPSETGRNADTVGVAGDHAVGQQPETASLSRSPAVRVAAGGQVDGHGHLAVRNAGRGHAVRGQVHGPCIGSPRVVHALNAYRATSHRQRR